ncbi:MAG: hypothetical protein AMXMBFR47_42520 [Planctomycetota bacterium]
MVRIQQHSAASITTGILALLLLAGAAGNPLRADDDKPVTGDAYYVLPIRGVFGLQVADSVVAAAYDEARKLKASAVVLEIESPGGSVEELKRIQATVRKYSDIRTIAYIREAKSAAAILAMSCPDIVMAPAAAIGAAVPLRIGPDGTPQNIEAKFESSMRADFRAAAENAGHEPLLVDGMMREDVELYLVRVGGGYKVSEHRGDKILKKKGQILTLTTKEALECGLSSGTATRIEDCFKALKLKNYRDIGPQGRERSEAWAKQVDEALEKMKESRRNFDKAITDANAALRARRKTDFTSALQRASSNLRRMEDICKKYPAIGDGDPLRDLRNRLTALRKSLER